MTKHGIHKRCERCAKTFYEYPYLKGKRRFCSQTCSNKTTNVQVMKTKRKQSFERVPVTTAKWRYTFAYIQWKTKVFERDNFTCVKCKAKKALIAHHIKSYQDYPELRIDVDNGITLCRSCHNRHDSGIVATQFKH